MKKIEFEHLFIFFLLVFAGAMPFSIAVTQIGYGAALVLWLAMAIRDKKKPFPQTPFDWLFAAMIAAEILATLFSPNRYASAEHFIKRALLLPIIYLITASVQNKKLLGKILLTLISVMIVVALIGIVKYNLGPGGLAGRLKLFHHYMTTGGILMIISLLTLSFVFSNAPACLRIAALLATIIMFIPLYYTYTRSSWLGFLAGLAFMVLFTRWKLIFVLAPALILAYLAAPSAAQDRMASVVNPWHPNNIERIYMWQAGLRMMQDSQFIGYGDSNLGKLIEKYRPAEAKERAGHLHNNFIMFGVILGIPGLLIVIALFIAIFKAEWRALKSAPRDDWLLWGTALGCVTVNVGFHVNGLFEWNFGDAEIAMLLWLTVGLALAVQRMRGVEA